MFLDDKLQKIIHRSTLLKHNSGEDTVAYLNLSMENLRTMIFYYCTVVHGENVLNVCIAPQEVGEPRIKL